MIQDKRVRRSAVRRMLMNAIAKVAKPRGRNRRSRSAMGFDVLEDRRLLSAQLADGGLRMQVVTAYNLVVDSNVESPSTYGPRAAYLGVTISNTGTGNLSDVVVNIGDLQNITAGTGTPGVYPVTTIPSSDPLRDYSGSFSLTHEGGVIDASRWIASIEPGQSLTQYFLVSYPVTDASNNSVVGSAPVVADDLEFNYDVWISASDPTDSVDGTRRVFEERRITARNEISAMANKIWPNSDGKVPDQYLDAFQESLGWRPSSGTTRIAGAKISEGVWYDLGNVGFGFDNDGDYVPDRNAWMQPVGDPDLFDATSGRLVKSYGLLIVKLNDGTEQILPFEDQLYFEHINPNNTGVVGLVWYEYLPLRYGSSLIVSPYQEVASGYDNEKFNGDYGTSVPAVTFGAPPSDLSFSKNGSSYVSGGEAAFSMLLSNSSSVTPFGWPDQGLPAVIEDSVPSSTTYKAGSAAATDVPTGASAKIYYSTDHRATWSATEPSWTDSNGNSLQDPGEGTVTDIRWVLSESLLNDSFEVGFRVLVPGNYSTVVGPVVDNTGTAGLLNGDAVLTDSHSVLVSGSLSIGDTIFKDDGTGTGATAGDGIQNGTEAGLSGITVTLYYDVNADGSIDDGDILWGTTVSNASGVYSFTGLPAADFIVLCDASDSDVPTGWNLSTDSRTAVTLTTANVTTVDFGFSPTLELTKTLQGQSPAYEGTLITYALELTNLLKGDGYAATVPSEQLLWLGTATGTFSNTNNATGAGTGTFASSATNGQTLNGTVPSVPAAASQVNPITHVEAVVQLYATPEFRSSDSLTIEVIRSGTSVGTYTVSSAIKAFTSSSATGLISINLTALGGWTWANLTNSATGLKLTFNRGSGSNPPTIYVDRFGFRVTSTADQNRDGYVYWSDATTTLKTGPATGGEIQLLMPSLSASVSDIANDYVNGFVYLGAGSSISKVDANGISSASFTAGGSITGLDVDPQGGYVYWVEGGNSIRRATLNFSSPTSSLVSGVTNVTALTIDPLGGRLYWSESGNQSVIIRSVRLVDLGAASPAVTTLLERKLNSSGNSNVEDIEVDYVGEKLYFTDNSTGPDYVGVVDLSGANAKKLIDLSATNPAPLGLALDSKRSRIFWADSTGVNVASVSGSGATLAYSGAIGVKDVEVPNFPREFFGSFDFNRSLTTVPLTDDYDPAELSFVSSSVTPSTVDATAGLLSWDNVGPINPGATKTILVTFRVLEPSGNSTDSSVVNTASVVGAKLANGLVANDDSGSSSISVKPTGAIGNFVWRDTDGGADQDSGEPGLAGVSVELYEDLDGDGVLDSGEPLVDTQVTDSNGGYLFQGLAPDDGTYKYLVKVSTTGFVSFTNTWDASSPFNSLSSVTMLNPAGASGPSDNLGQDFGYSFTNNTRVYGSVWKDYDRDGVRDGGVDSGISGVTVGLYNSSNTLVTTTSTAGDGSWNFYGVAPGAYSVRVTTSTLPSSGTWQQTADPDATLDSITPTGSTFSVVSGGSSGSWDFGYGLTGTASLGDTVFIDWDGDNILDAADGDVGIPNVTVQLYLDLNSNGDLDLGSDPLVSVAVTDASGAYSFATLPAGTWFVRVDESDSDFPPNVTASTDNPASAVLYSGTALTTVDFGYQPFGDGTVSGVVWDDADFDDVRQVNEGIFGNVSVELWWDRFGDGTYVLFGTAVTDSEGAYSLTSVPYGNYEVRVVSSDADIPSGHVATTSVVQSVTLTSAAPTAVADFGFAALPSLGDTVYFDANRNGSQDAWESGISGVTVRLYLDTNADGLPDGSALKTTTTDSDGIFRFTEVSHTEAGNYYVVVVDTGTLPGSMLNSGDPDRDGVAWSGTADSFPSADNRDSFIEVSTGSYRGADFGYVPPGVVGDFVWLDLDGDGVQASGEPGIAGVTVTAFRSASSTTITTETDQDGRYGFFNLADGVWTISISGSGLSGLVGTYDADGGSFSTTSVTLSAGVISSPVIGSLDVDFGLKLGGGFSLSGTVATHDARTSGTADDIDNFADDGIDRDAGSNDEVELSDQSVYLYQIVSGTAVYRGTTQTDADGNYEFSGLPSGDYRVVLSTTSLMLEYSTLTTTAASSPASAVDSFGRDSDSDGDLDVLTAVSQSVAISGADVTDVDFTFVSNADFDFGDLPDSYSGTKLSQDGARHVIPAGGSQIWLGTAPDADVDGASGAFADGDDLLGSDDDDGVTPLNIGSWVNGASGGSILVTLPSGKTGYLTGWIDFNHDDSLVDSGEFIVSQWITGTGTSQVLSFAIPAGTIGTGSESWLARFRVFAEVPDLPLFAYEGVAVDGEVEDYLFQRNIGASIGNRVWVDSDSDGSQDAGENGKAHLLVTLRDASGNAIATQLTSNGTEDVDNDGVIDPLGFYRFTGLTATTDYRVTVTAPAGFGLSYDEDSGTGSPDGSILVSDLEVTSEHSTADFGLSPQTAMISGHVYNDAYSGTIGDFDAGDTVVANSVVQLWLDPNEDGDLSDAVQVAETTTATDGSYQFTGVPSGKYVLIQQDLTGFTSVRDIDSTNDNQITVSMTGTNSVGNNFLDFNSVIAYDLSVTKTDGTSTVVPGQTTTYTIVVSNAGPSTATSISVSDTKPSWISSWTWSGNGLTGQTGNLSDTISSLSSGSSVTYTVVATVAAGATGSSLSNTVTISGAGDTNSANDSATDTNTADVQYDVSVTKTDGTSTVVPGLTTTYTIVVSNAGPSTATSISVSDTKPSWISSWTWSGNGLTGQTGNLSDTISSLSSGSSVTYTVVATVAAGATGSSLSNTVTISGADDTNSANDSATDTNTADVQYDVSVTKTDGTSTVVPGLTTTYTIVVSNAGPSTATSISVSDTKPSWISSWTWSGNGLTGQTGNLSDTISSLSSGSSVTYTVVATVAAGATGSSLSNTVTISGADDTDSANDSATDTNTADVQYDVSVTKTDGTSTVVPGLTTTYTIVVSNAGPSTATSISVSDTKPSWISSWTWSGNGLTGQTGNLSDTISSLSSGSSVTYTVVATVAASATGSSLSNTVTISGADDTNSANDSATDTNTADVQYDVSVTKTDGTSTVVPGQTTTYTIVVSNAGPSTATSISVSDTKPSWISSWTWSGNGLTGQTGNLSDTISSLSSGSSVTYTVVATVAAGATGSSLSNTVTISGADDTNSANDSATDTNTADVQYDVSVTKTDGTSTVVPGLTTTYTIVVSNAGPSTATSISVSDTKPSWISSWTWSGNGLTGQTGNLSDTISSLSSGSSVTYTVVATVSAGATGSSLSNTVTISGADDTNSANDSATDTNTADVQYDVSVTKTDGTTTVVPGQTTTYTIVVSNAGPSTATSISVSDAKPSWISSWTWSGNGLTGRTGNLSDTISSLSSGSSVTYTVVATVSNGATGNSLSNTVTIAGSDDTNSSNDTATDTDAALLAPTANNDSRIGLSPGSQSLQVTANDTDPLNSLDSSTVDLQPSVSGDQKTLVVSGQGTWTALADGWVRFDPVTGFTLDPTSITYTVRNTGGLVSNVANISLDYRPVANPDNSSNNAVGTAVTLNVLANDNGGDTDFDYGSLRILGTNAAGDPLVVTGQGTWTVNLTNGRITFTPEPGFTADPSPIRYNVRDTDGNLSNYAAVTIDYIDACVGFPLTLIIDDLSTSGYDIIVVDNAAAGTATSFGNSTHADVNLTTLGNLAFIGSTAKFSYITATVLSKPYLSSPSAPDMSLTTSVRSSGSGGQIVIYATDGCFSITPGGSYSLVSPLGGTTNGTVSFTETIDPTNTALGTGTGRLSNALGPYSTRSYSGTASRPFSFGVSDVSLTKTVNVTHGSGTNLSTSLRAGGAVRGDTGGSISMGAAGLVDDIFVPQFPNRRRNPDLFDSLLLRPQVSVSAPFELPIESEYVSGRSFGTGADDGTDRTEAVRSSTMREVTAVELPRPLLPKLVIPRATELLRLLGGLLKGQFVWLSSEVVRPKDAATDSIEPAPVSPGAQATPVAPARVDRTGIEVPVSEQEGRGEHGGQDAVEISSILAEIACQLSQCQGLIPPEGKISE